MQNYFYNTAYEAGKVIVDLHKGFVESSDPIGYINRALSGIEYQKVDLLIKSQKSRKISPKTDIGGVVLVHLKNQEMSAVLQAAAELSENLGVVYAEPNYLSDAYVIPNDPYFGDLWGMKKIKAPRAWDYATGNPNVTVGVVDSGIDHNHPDIIKNMWVSSNRRIVNGWNFVRNNRDSMDITGHGTHVAGTIGAVGNNHIGVAGVCWNVKVSSLRIGDNRMSLDAAIASIAFAIRNNIFILNNSWGGRFYSPSLKYAIEQYEGLYVVAAGNDGYDNDRLPVYPASYDSDNIISVAASAPNDRLASFSNYGVASVDIAAPGVDVFSLDLRGRYSRMNGTSMAAPHVAGAAALLKSYLPHLSALEIKDIILSSAAKLPHLAGKILTGGILDTDRMMAMGRRAKLQ
ncbi:MAG: S8 family serine peptidase [Oscillospiraceae bacterium]|nr:S8 family serine peptidase [Oscillospiraceae bacterium]